MDEPDEPRRTRQPDAERYRDRIDISDEDDDFEYEVEPVDEEVLARERARAEHELAVAESTVDVDAVYRELERRDDFDAAFEKFKAKFSLKSLLVGMTVLAVILGIGGSDLLSGASFAAFICLSLLGLGSAHAWLNFQERRRREEVLARRDRQLRRAEHIANNPGVPYEEEEDDTPAANESNPLADFVTTMTKLPRFSVSELMIATTGAAIVTALLYRASSLASAAMALGVLALAGFALQAAEVATPRLVVLGWWLSLIGFAVLTLGMSAAGLM